jgi:glutaredoxin-related protein
MESLNIISDSKMYSREQIIEDESFKLFLKNNKKLRENTIKGYVMAVNSFCNSSGKNPFEIVEICKDDLRNNIPEFDQWILKALMNFKSDMENTGLKRGTIAKNIGILKSFLRDFHITPLPDIKIDSKKIDKEPSEYLGKEDIIKASKYAKPVYRAVYIVQSQTGLAITDTLKLKVGHFIKAVSRVDEELTLKEAVKKVDDKKISYGCLDLTRRKTGRRFYTFISYEGLLAIAEYLEIREHHLNNDDFIFLKETDRLPQGMRKKVYKSSDLEIMATAADSYTNRLNRRYFNNRKDKNDYCYFRTHKIRSWYSNQLYLAGIDWKDIKFLMGQRTNDVLERYVDVNAYESLKKNYEKALNNLQLNEKVIIKDTDRVKKLEAELREGLKEKDDEIAAIKKRMKEMEKLMADKEFVDELAHTDD